MKNNKIDFVITWVDGNDEAWKISKQKFLKDFIKDNPFIENKFYNDERYRDLENLKYWFRGVEQFAPWVNKIFFVTNGQIPDWLNTNNEKLVLVNHEDFIPKKYLPTFNSEAIEVNLYKIKELSENFVYFNDDLFLIDKVIEEDFFKNNLPCDSAVLGIVPMNNESYTAFNNTVILNKYFNKKQVIKENFSKWFNLKYKKYILKNILLYPYKTFTGMTEFHICNSLKKSTFIKLSNLESEAFEVTSNNKFRNRNDINLWLLKNYQMLNGNFYPRKSNFGKSVKIGEEKSIENIILNQKYKVLCINDNSQISEKEFEIQKKNIILAFEKILPNKSSFEK